MCVTTLLRHSLQAARPFTIHRLLLRGLSRFCTDFRVVFSVSVRGACGIRVGTASLRWLCRLAWVVRTML